MEIVNLQFFSPTNFITIVFSTLVSCFFLVYAYAVAINGLGAKLYSRDLNKLNTIKVDYIRFRYVEKLSLES